MATTDPRVDAYIEKAADFAQPILRHLRDVVHDASPDIEETMKWGFPHFTYRGIVCSMAAFKGHCAFGFWKEQLVLGSPEPKAGEAMGQFGRITGLSDLPPRDVLIGYVREAVRLNEEGVKVPASKAPKAVPPLLEAFRAALERNPAAKAGFEGFSPSHRREYVEWIAEARREETRDRRIAAAIEWLSEGKPRNWRYMKETR
jgi:uncharacterized protein YdeI (YjbR/CyaY-like superfamily)